MIVLASASPRRRELLSLIIPEFIVAVSDVDETTDILDAAARVRHLAQRKARHVARRWGGNIVIGADTVVEVCGEILEKPKDRADAARMIRLLSGRTHTVYTGVCVIGGGEERVEHCATAVEFAALTDTEIAGYVGTEPVLDKAGAYAIQGGAAKFIKRVNGCFFNVVGLPVHLLYDMLKAMALI